MTHNSTPPPLHSSMNHISIGIARASKKDITASYHLLAILDDLDTNNHPLRAGTTFLRDENGQWNDADPDAFDIDDPAHCRTLTERLLKILEQSPGFLCRIIGGFASLLQPSNALIDPDADCLTPHPEIVAAKEKAAHYDQLRTALEKLGGYAKSVRLDRKDPTREFALQTVDWCEGLLELVTQAEATLTSQSGQPSQSGPTTDALQLALRSLQFFVDQCRGDSGTGESHWEQFPQYRQAVSLLRLCTTGPVVPKTEVHDLPTPANLVQVGDLWVCEDEDSPPDQIPFALLIQCSSAEQCRAAMKAGTVQFTQFAHYTTQNGTTPG